MGLCLACCVTSPSFIAVSISDGIALDKHFSGKLQKGFSLRGFSETGAFIKTYDLATLFPGSGRTGKYCPQNDMKTFFALKIIPWLETKPSTFRTNLTNGEEMYIAEQLGRNAVAWIMECPMSYAPYTADGVLRHIPEEKSPYDEARVMVFANKISNPVDKQAIRFDTKDPAEISALEHRFIKVVMERLATFDVSACMEQIYNNIVAGKAQDFANAAHVRIIQ